jgi:histidine phosphotransferase ChpT
MPLKTEPTDLELAALLSSKICHDVIGPVGAINNGLEILDEDDTADTKSYALDVIKSVTQQASARLQFARFAFGAAGSAGSAIELDTARELAMAFVGERKHQLTWDGPNELMSKDFVKLLLNMVACAIAALPRGGVIAVEISGTLERSLFSLRCTGRGARAPHYLKELTAGEELDEVDTMSIQAYYTWRLADQARMAITIAPDGDEAVVLKALPLAS